MTEHDLHNKAISMDLFERKRLNTLVGVNKEVSLKLGKAGYSLMKDLLNAAGSKDGRHKLAAELGIPYDDLYTIVLCCDMAQVVGLSGKLLHYLFESGYHTLASIQEADADELNRAVICHLACIGKKPTLPSCSRPGNWIGAARLIKSRVEPDSP